MPGSRLRRSAARSNCCWATSQALIGAATCSVVMNGDPPCAGRSDAVPDRWVVSRTTPRGATRDAAVAGRLDVGCAASRSSSIATGSRADARCRSSPCRNRSVTSCVPCRDVGTGCAAGATRRGRAGVSAGRGPPRRRSPGRGAARPTAPTSAIGTVAGSRPGRAPGPRRGTPRRPALTVCRIASRSIGRARDQLDAALARLRRGSATRSAVSTTPSLDRDDRLDREERPDRRLGAADPAALLEVLERLEGDVHPHVAGPRPRGPRRSRPPDAPARGHLDGPSGRGSPRPSTRPASRRRGSRGRAACRGRSRRS